MVRRGGWGSARWWLVLVACIAGGCVSYRPRTGGRAAGSGGPKYVFLFIGDGMGLVQTHATEMYRYALRHTGEIPPPPGSERLNFTRFPVVGLITTHSANFQITDSAAAGTALAAGYKTANGVNAMDPDFTVCYGSVATAAHARGMKVGIVSSGAITDATPAVFYAHQGRRSDHYEIGLQLVDSPFEYFAGAPVGKAADGPQGNLLELAAQHGFKVATTREELEACRPGRRAFFQGRMPFEIDRPAERVSLAELTAKGIELLDNPDGFFLMVEGAKIDGAAHHNDAATLVREMLAFDAAVAEALRFYRRHPLETLIVVTGDHETGAMTLNIDGKKSPRGIASLADQRQSWAAFAFVFFTPFLETQEWASDADNIPDVLKEALRETFGLDFAELSEAQMAALEAAYDASLSTRGVRDEQGRRPLLPGYGRYEPLPMTAARIVGQRAGIGWATNGHSPVPLPVWALGAAAYRFDGYYDNTDIAKRIADALRIELPPPVEAPVEAEPDTSRAPEPDYTQRMNLPPSPEP